MHRSSLRHRRRAALVLVAALALSACTGSDDSSSDTTAATDTAPDTTVDTTAAASTTAATTTTAPTTVPATTAAESTTTVPATSAPSTSVPGTTLPEVAPEALAQFCFDSEQVYVADLVDEGPTELSSEELQAATTYLRRTVDVAAASAPEGFGDEPQRAAELLGDLDGILQAHEYDLGAAEASDDADQFQALTAEFDGIMDDLDTMLGETCESQFTVLDRQADKLTPIIVTVVGWQLLAVTNVAGDIRLFVPPEWNDWAGSAEIEEVTVLLASTDIAEFEASFDVPGVATEVYYVEIGVADPSTRLEGTVLSRECTPVSSEPYDDPVYTGELHFFENCGGTGTEAALLLATDADRSIEVVLQVGYPGGLDREQLDQLLALFAAGI